MAEVLVFSTILLVLTGCIATVVQGAMRTMHQGAAYQDAQRQALVAMKKMTEDLSRSTNARRDPFMPIDPPSSHITFLTPQPESSTEWTYKGTSLLYHAWLCYYHDRDKKQLMRVRIPLSSPGPSNEVGEAPELSEVLRGGPDYKVEVIARGIDSLEITDGANGQQLSLRLTASAVTGTDRTTTVASRTMVTMPNR